MVTFLFLKLKSEKESGNVQVLAKNGGKDVTFWWGGAYLDSV